MSASENKLSKSQPEKNPVSQEIIHRFLDNQTKELEVEVRRTELQEKDIDNKHEYAKKLLEAQKEDLVHQRKHAFRSRNATYLFSGSMVLIAIAFLVYCLQTENKEIALDILEKGLTLGTGALAGYFFGEKKGRKESENKGDYAQYEEVKE